MALALLTALLLAPVSAWPSGQIRVIAAGVSRTSTQSLSLALTRLGYKTLHAEGFHPKIPLYKEAPELVDMVTKAALKSLQAEDFNVLLPVLAHIERLNVTALVDIPWSAYGVELHEKYPNAKIILTVRDKHSWFQSYWEHFRWGAILPPPPFPSFPITQPFPLTVLYQPFVQYWRLVSQRLQCTAITSFPPRMLSRKDKQDCLDGFEMHIERLKNAVPLESLLIYNIREGWDPLCRFLGVPVPDFPFPREDSYSMIHWKVGPVIFLVVVYLFYGLVLLLLHFILTFQLRKLWRQKRD
ncbi:unnamed protein product [Durusdinium trenchii]|uniref:Uncharacterized protein n=2 Tax=Durusdinium trenchii TaxID=1381693 RepID=A0ABP0LDE6_9DINO